MYFKDLKRWVVIKMFVKNIPGSNCIREEAILETIWFTNYFTKSVTNVSTEQDSANGR